MALNDLSVEQIKATFETERQVTKLLDYLATHLEATITYKPSSMHLNIHSDASHLFTLNSCSTAGGYHYLGTHSTAYGNVPIHVECKIMKHVLASAAEVVEIGAIYQSCRQGDIIRPTLKEIGHKQSTMIVVIDTTTVNGLFNRNIKRERTRLWTCNLIGFQIDRHMYKLMYNGNQESATWLNTSQNIIQLFITKECVKYM